MTSATVSHYDLLGPDEALDTFVSWRQAGKQAVLVSLVRVDGNTPRPLGSHMAVCEDGQYVGYLSGGCLEDAVAAEALASLSSRSNNLERFGKGSRYFDLRLPCGSGLDLYFDQRISRDIVDRCAELRRARACFWLRSNVGTGEVDIQVADGGRFPRTFRESDWLHRAVIPRLRIAVIGAGPAFTAIATVARAAGFEVIAFCPEERSRQELRINGLDPLPLARPDDLDVSLLDRASAAVLAFHEHSYEPQVIAALLQTDCFYVGAMGSRTAHRQRIESLEKTACAADALSRLRAPIGCIAGAKNRVTLAVGVLAEICSEAKSRGLFD